MKLKESLVDISMHWFGKILTTNLKIFRLFWIGTFLAHILLLLSMTGKDLSEYLKFPIVNREDNIFASELVFPSVTICGPLVSKRKLKENAEAFNITVDFDEGSAALGQQRHIRKESILKKLQKGKNLLKVAPDKASFFLTNLNGSCMKSDAQECNMTSDIERTLVFNRGYCYKLNPRGTFRQTAPGAQGAITVTLFLNVSDILPWFEHDVGDAVDVLVDNHEEYPFGTNPVLAKVGAITNIVLRRKEIIRKGWPFVSNCTDRDSDKTYFPGAYSVLNCKKSNILSKITEMCQNFDFFTNVFLPKEKRRHFTNEESQDACSFEKFERMNSDDSDDCQQPCHEIKFETSLSHSEWPSTANIPTHKMLFSTALGLNSSQMTEEFIRRNFLKLRIYYSGLKYSRFSEDPAHLLGNVFGNIGGYMGLLMGASIVSLVELVVMLSHKMLAMVAEVKTRRNDLETTGSIQ